MVVFLTGAAGLLGGAIAHDLVRRGHSVIGLTHRDSAIRGNDGTALDAAPFTGTIAPHGEVRTLKGDVTLPDLGLDEAMLTALINATQCVIHCAALVKFEADFADLEAVNVSGTKNLATLFRDARFVHVSTAYTCGVFEGVIEEHLHDPEGGFANGYERSKALAEGELLAIRPDAIIARPSIILGEHKSGRIRSFDTIYAAFKLIAEGRIKHVPVATGASLNFVPIDHVVDGTVALALANEAGPHIVHLVARKAIATERFLAVIKETPGLNSPEITRPDETAPKPANMMQRLVQPYLSYFTRSPEFETRALARLTGIESPDMDEADLANHIAFCVETGFIKPRGAGCGAQRISG